MGAVKVVVSDVLPYTAEMQAEVLYGYGPRPAPAWAGKGWPVQLDAWVSWGIMELPRMHWAAERRCPFVRERSAVVGWDGGIAPCYALAHTYIYFAVDGRRKRVSRYLLGNINLEPLLEIWTGEEYCRFRHAVEGFSFPSCPDCDLRESCDLREQNAACWGWNPSCADCFWAQNIIRCPGGGR